MSQTALKNESSRKILFKSGTIITAAETFDGDILIEGKRSPRLGRD